ncbi:MAG: hypothetical protein P8Y99_11015, partial [Calditrichaceae bacterium]
CEKDPTSSNSSVEVKHNGAFIINEGGINKNNGSISFYSPGDQLVQNDIFKRINDNEQLGDIVQSMTVIDSLGFIIVNNSNKIEVVDMNTWEKVKTIDMPPNASPRYLADGENGKAYVTNLYGNNVSVIDLSTIDIIASITVGANPEEITVSDDKAYVANSGGGDGNTLSVINLPDDQVVSTITVGDNPVSIRKDESGILHVLCWGSWNKGTKGGIYSVDPNTDTVLDSLVTDGYSSKLCIGPDNIGYFINNGNILSFSTDTYNVVNDSLIMGGSFYGIAYEPVSRRIFALDAKDYVQDGSLLIYDMMGNLLESYNVGVSPGSLTFIYE